MQKKILFVGESWAVNTLEIKGCDHFYIGGYGEGTEYIQAALSECFDFKYLSATQAPATFPTDMETLQQYDAILLSDIGANSLLLNPKTFYKFEPTPNRLDLIAKFVRDGGGFGMIGGYMTFMGIEGKGFYKDTIIEDILPVNLLTRDDRVEQPQGITVVAEPSSHTILSGVDREWPLLLGYNRLIPKENAQVLATYGKDPILTIGTYGKGRTLAFASDCAPHWAPPQFCEWSCYRVLWQRMVQWLVMEL